MKSYLIRWSREESGAIISDLWTVIFHWICLNKTSKKHSELFYKVTNVIDDDIIVTAFLCVCCYPKKNIDIPNKQP